MEFKAIYLSAVSINIIFPYKRDFNFVSYCMVALISLYEVNGSLLGEDTKTISFISMKISGID